MSDYSDKYGDSETSPRWSTPLGMSEEVEWAVSFRDLHLIMADELVHQYTGSRYRKDWDPDFETHENHAWMFVQNVLPQLMYAAPKTKFEAGIPGMVDYEVEALEAVHNYILRATDAETTFIDIARDCLFSYGVGMRKLVPLPGSEYDLDNPDAPLPLIPKYIHIEPHHYFRDPLTTDRQKPRYEGHIWVQDRHQMLAAKDSRGKPLYDHDVINRLADVSLDDYYGERERSFQRLAPERNEIVGCDIFVHEEQTWYSLPYNRASGDTEWLREPRAYIGHPAGPYQLFGLAWVPNEVYPMPLMAATAELVDEINAHAGQASDDAGSAKRLIVVDTNQPGLIGDIESSPNGTVLGIPGAKSGAVTAIEVGGPQAANLQYMGLLQERLDRMSGVTDTAKGKIDPNATATAEVIAENASKGRIQMMRRMFQNQLIKLMDRGAYDLWESSACRCPAPMVDVETGQRTAKWWIGGGSEIGYEHIQMTIEPYSSEWTDSAVIQRRMQTAVAMTLQIAPALLQFPFIKGKPLLDDLYESINIPNGGQKYIDFELLSALMGFNQLAQLQQQFMGEAQAQQDLVSGAAMKTPGSLGKEAKGGPGSGGGGAPGAAVTPGTANPGFGGGPGGGASPAVNEQSALIAKAFAA